MAISLLVGLPLMSISTYEPDVASVCLFLKSCVVVFRRYSVQDLQWRQCEIYVNGAFFPRCAHVTCIGSDLYRLQPSVVSATTFCLFCIRRVPFRLSLMSAFRCQMFALVHAIISLENKQMMMTRLWKRNKHSLYISVWGCVRLYWSSQCGSAGYCYIPYVWLPGQLALISCCRFLHNIPSPFL